MIILGIDPALTKTGYGVIDTSNSSINYIASGTILTQSTDNLETRLGFLASEIERIIRTYNPNIVAMEEVFININAKSSIKLCHARGAIMSAIGQSGLVLKEFSPTKIKKTISGAGKADKSQIIYMVRMIMPKADIKSEDEADALAAAYACHAYM